MPLTDTEIRAAKPRDKPYRLFDGGGLYLEISTSGGKLWRLKYRYGDKKKRLSFGMYLDVPLAGRKDAKTGRWIDGARDRREAARQLLASGVDPGAEKKAIKATKDNQAANSFEVVAWEWLERFGPQLKQSSADRKLTLLERDVISLKPIYYVTTDAKFMVAPSAANLTLVINGDGTDTLIATPASGSAPTWTIARTILSSTDGDIKSQTIDSQTGSTVATYDSNNVTTKVYSQIDGGGTLLSTSYGFDVLSANQAATANLTYNGIAELAGLPGVGGGVLAALNFAASGANAPAQDQIVIPAVEGETRAVPGTAGSGIVDDIPGGYDVSYVIDKDTLTYFAIGTQPPGGSNILREPMCYVVDSTGNLLGTYQFDLISSVIQQPDPAPSQKGQFQTQAAPNTAPANELVIGAGSGSVTFTAKSDTPTVSGSGFTAAGALMDQAAIVALAGSGTVKANAAITGGTIASLDSTDDLPDEDWSIVAGSATSVTITGLTGSGFTGAAALSGGVGQVILGDQSYGLDLVTAGATVGIGQDGDIVAETAGAAHKVDFTQDGTAYWHVAGSGDSATLDRGTTEIYMPGPAADYTEAYAGTTGVLTLTDSGKENTGTTTLTIGGALGGTGEVTFSDGTVWELGDTGTGDPGAAKEFGGVSTYGDGTNSFVLSGGDQSVYGAGTNAVAKLTSGEAVPGQDWDIYEDGTGDTVLDGTDAGYDGVATLSNLAAVVLGDTQAYVPGTGYTGSTGSAYALVTTPQGGGELTVSTPAAIRQSYGTTSPTGTILAEQDGATNTVTIASYAPTWWQVNGTGDTAYLDGAQAELYLPGDESDYTITWYGGDSDYAGWIDVSDSVTGRSGDFQAYQGGGSGELTFADGSVIGLGVSADDVDLTSYLADLGAYATPDASWFFSQTSDGGVLADGSNAGYGAIVLEGVPYVEMGGTAYTLQTTQATGGETDVFGDGTIVVDGAGNDLLTFQNDDYTAWYAGGGNDTADLYSGSTEIVFDEAAADYTISNPSKGIVTVRDNVGAEGTKTIDVEAGTGELLFADGAAIGLGITTDATNYAGAGYDTFYLAGGTTESQGPTGVANIAVFESGSSVPGGLYGISADGYGDVEVDGQAAGYDGSAILSGIAKVELGGVTYGLMTALVGDDGVTGIPLTIGPPAAGTTATIVVDGPENDALTFSGTGTSYWHAGAGTDTATVAAGTVDVYFQGASAQYTVKTTSTGVTVTDSQASRDGVKTLKLTGGATTLVFTDKSEVLSNPPVTLTGTSGNDTFTLTTAESASVNGEAGTDTVVFSSSTVLPTGAWSITENASAQGVVTGTSAVGYTGTATLTSVEQLKIDGNTYALVTTPVAGGKTTIATPGTGVAGTIVADGAGADALAFSGTGTSYWHVGAGNNTAALSAGKTEIYFTGASSQYSETYNGTNQVTVKNTATSATDTITLSAGSGELVFASGGSIGLNKSGDTTIYGGSSAATLTGTTGADTIYAGSAADTLVGDGGADTYKIGGGTTTETIQNGVSTSNTAAGNLDFTAASSSSLWLMDVGNNLVIDVLGTTRQTVVKNWFASGDTYARTSEIVSADSLKLDAAVNNLVSAMASFSTSHATFNPQTTTNTTLTNSTFYGTLSATDKSSWHT